jgi:hypothetical protein
MRVASISACGTPSGLVVARECPFGYSRNCGKGQTGDWGMTVPELMLAAVTGNAACDATGARKPRDMTSNKIFKKRQFMSFRFFALYDVKKRLAILEM